ncbi:hypothetical protein CAPTEDRAFT_170265, partial [Capitella teleta]
MDPHLAGYFSNTRMRSHLSKVGLVTRRGEIVSENTYRMNMARKEHKKHVRDLMAQAIVHKTLDMERNRQVAIKQKLEEISKIELVRRVKAETGRRGDEDVLPYLSPQRSQSGRGRPASSVSGSRTSRPVSAPARGSRKRSKSPSSDQQIPLDLLPPHRSPSPRSKPRTRLTRRQVRPTTSVGKPVRPRSNKVRHQERVQTMCDVHMHFFGSNLNLDYEKFDPRDEIMVEQQHCGGNTLIVFKEKILPASDFCFTSRRHRGYPFSLTFYVNGVLDCRLSACCEFKHQVGSRLGGSKGHFGVLGVEGGVPCYRCQLSEQQKPKSKPRPKKEKENDIEITVEEERQARDEEAAEPEPKTIEVEVKQHEQTSEATDDHSYEDDFDDDENQRSSRSRSSSRSTSSRSRSSSSSRSYSSDEGSSTPKQETGNVEEVLKTEESPPRPPSSSSSSSKSSSSKSSSSKSSSKSSHAD